MKILHLPTATGGNAWGLSQGERRLGLDVTVLTLEKTHVGYPCDICLNLEKSGKAMRFLKRMQAFLHVRNRYDVFHFNFGQSLIDIGLLHMNKVDLPWYPKGKKIVFTYNGCDARQKFPTMNRTKIAACHQEGCYGGMCNSGGLDKARRSNIEIVARHAHQIFAVNPDLLNFLPKGSQFLPYTIAPWYEIEAKSFEINKKLRILHAPSQREAKGTGFILAALDKIKEKYPDRIEIVLVEGMSHSEAMTEYRKADLVIDQVLIGWYGAFAVEVMKMGIPVAVFIREEDLHFLPPGMAKDLQEAIINVTPFSIESTLLAYIESPEKLKQKRDAALDYIHKWHHPEYVASITKAAYQT